jgi:cytochrome P450 family 6
MALTQILVYLIFPAAIFIYFFLKKKFSYFSDLDIPHMKPKWPMGNVSGMGTKYHMFDIVLKVYNECKGKDVICGFYSFFKPVYMVIDPEFAKIVMVKDFNYFVNRSLFVNEEKEPLTGKGRSLR